MLRKIAANIHQISQNDTKKLKNGNKHLKLLSDKLRLQASIESKTCTVVIRKVLLPTSINLRSIGPGLKMSRMFYNMLGLWQHWDEKFFFTSDFDVAVDSAKWFLQKKTLFFSMIYHSILRVKTVCRWFQPSDFFKKKTFVLSDFSIHFTSKNSL